LYRGYIDEDTTSSLIKLYMSCSPSVYELKPLFLSLACQAFTRQAEETRRELVCGTLRIAVNN